MSHKLNDQVRFTKLSNLIPSGDDGALCLTSVIRLDMNRTIHFRLISRFRVMPLVDAASGRVQCAYPRTLRRVARKREVNAAGGRVYICAAGQSDSSPKTPMIHIFHTAQFSFS